MYIRNFLYDQNWKAIYESPVPTLSVGNISVGGTGKTPTSEYVLSYYRAKGVKVAYLSRGYGRKSKGYLKVLPKQGEASVFGDEALQVAHKFPDLIVAVCEDRRTGIQRLLEEGVEIIILDDAFQHRKVSRAIDLVLVDANRLPTEDSLLPAGRLREPLSSLKRSHMLIVNKIRDPQALPAIEESLRSYQPNLAFAQPTFRSIQAFFPHSPPPPSLKGQEFILFSGIGNNQYFQYQVEQAGAKVLSSFFFRDHQAYTRQDLLKIAQVQEELSQNSPNFKSVWILTTEKDFFRLKGESWLSEFQEILLGYLPIEIHWIKGKEEVHKLLDSLLPH